MPCLARCQEFHWLSMRRHRVLSRQSGGLKRKNPGPSRRSLLRLIFSPGKCRLSIGCAGGSLLSSRASSSYKGIRKSEFQKIGRIKAAPYHEGLFMAANPWILVLLRISCRRPDDGARTCFAGSNASGGVAHSAEFNVSVVGLPPVCD